MEVDRDVGDFGAIDDMAVGHDDKLTGA